MLVMAGQKCEARLRASVPAIHVLSLLPCKSSWMAGTSPAMTGIGCLARKRASRFCPGMTVMGFGSGIAVRGAETFVWEPDRPFDQTV
jgi:hypothetical protein